MSNMKTHTEQKFSLKSEIRKAYKKTPMFALDQLLEQESYWRKKETIAKNKLLKVRKKINSLAVELAKQNIERGEHGTE